MRGTRVVGQPANDRDRIIPAHAGNSDPLTSTSRRGTDHPRACGELFRNLGTLGSLFGSSPRMRGTQAQRIEELVEHRIIPAHAGNSMDMAWSRLAQADHPRACGELDGHGVVSSRSGGSSPRMRGTQLSDCLGARRSRIIPAHAGNSSNEGGAVRWNSDHPRACGELMSGLFARALALGSSPRMRGTPRRSAGAPCRSRIIPAHARNSHFGFGHWRGRSDHPRACGELLDGETERAYDAGSSPRMRRTRAGLVGRLRSGRIIPAHAGNSLDTQPGRHATADHPRACGELLNRSRGVPLITGSSPRMRGTPDRLAAVLAPKRIIPAHAGNSLRLSPPTACRTDHPRACGELWLHVDRPHALVGSSPRMRGTPCRASHTAIRTRIIPAHAGNSHWCSNPGWPSTDHPRACGELCLRAAPLRFRRGSSPRMRGTLEGRGALVPLGRITGVGLVGIALSP